MSFIYSRALVEEYLQVNSSDSIQYALSNETNTASMFLSKDRTMELSHVSQYGMTYAHLGENRGVELWTWFLVDSPAKRSVLQQEVEILKAKTSGPKCDGLYEKYVQSSSLLKMFPSKPYWRHKPTSWRMGITPSISKCLRESWVRIIYGKDFGYLHTPTCTANFAAESMQKHRTCRNFMEVFGRPSPTSFEHLMGWPIGWTDLKPLEMGKYHLWRQWHFSRYI